MATLTAYIAGQVLTAAELNASFNALNTEVRAVAVGGTGASTLTQDGILMGNATGPVTALAATQDQVLRAPHGGTTPAFGNLHSSMLVGLGTGSGTGRPVASSYMNVTTTGNSAGAATDLHAWSMPANTLIAAGDGLVIRSRGVFAANGNAKTLTLNWAGGIIQTLNNTGSPNDKAWMIDMVLILTDATHIALFGTLFLSAVGGTSPTIDGLGVSTGTVAPTGVVSVAIAGNGAGASDVVARYTTIWAFRAPS